MERCLIELIRILSFFCGELEASAFITWRDAELCGGIMVRILWSVEELGQSYYSWKHILSYILREMPRIA